MQKLSRISGSVDVAEHAADYHLFVAGAVEFFRGVAVDPHEGELLDDPQNGTIVATTVKRDSSLQDCWMRVWLS